MTANEFKYWEKHLSISDQKGGWIDTFTSYAKHMQNPPDEETMQRYGHIFIHTNEKMKTEEDHFVIRGQHSKKIHKIHRKYVKSIRVYYGFPKRNFSHIE